MSKKLIADTFFEIADAIESGKFEKKKKIGLTTLGSEHGSENLINGAKLANNGDFEIVLIGKGDSEFESYETKDEEEMYQKMEELLDSNVIQACVTMHYNFPIGVSTVGRVVVPANGREMFISSTTGTTATDRIESMVRNTINGIAAAKSCGIKKPKVGILNVDGARQVENILVDLKNSGYEIDLAESMRADGGHVMRGNDLLAATPDVMVSDTLTGNLLMKIFSSFNTGGNYEAVGYGYGPGIGENYNRNVFILSRASGTPVVANALKYANDVVSNDINEIAKKEYENANKCGLTLKIEEIKSKKSVQVEEEKIEAPDKEVVTESIAGIDILDIEDAVKSLWKEKVYAESGMGCTGPAIMVSKEKLEIAMNVLKENKYII
ncbi:glycine/sarcosine/betaine reductase complex component C subunit alpha [Peptostreptococcus faecalis]|uniref:glycine/sarcosine/betaine reductase complex component C subunit alpha n=1 Tax=Peptostreptococcus faecalis TaxID=2045015 RepID=UPI000C7BE5CB|nr:glycine/sarcosine/betaine reductase complex component C subunit alpha [Peptostreptococcus faecalis]